jgi:medium-chain acyl-[acyl-carrier-protein] hydrolase
MFLKRYTVSSYLTNAQGKLGLYSILNLLQDIAIEHAQELGFGYEEMQKREMFWVLTRQKLMMKKWPCWLDKIEIQTWIRLGEGAASNRDFRILLDNEVIGECTTSWVTLNAQTRRPIAFDRSKFLSELQDVGRVEFDTPKVVIEEVTDKLISFKVRNSDIDQNMHVNNTKYAQWILDAIPFEAHFISQLYVYEVNFLAEVKLNDVISIEKGASSNDEDVKSAKFQGRRESDLKIVFTANLNYSNKNA